MAAVSKSTGSIKQFNVLYLILTLKNHSDKKHPITEKEILDHLDGLCSLDEAADRIRQESRHFAKRQLTWFRRERDVIWIDRQQYISQEMITDHMIRILKVGQKHLLIKMEMTILPEIGRIKI